jgi:hypothetical protein
VAEASDCRALPNKAERSLRGPDCSPLRDPLRRLNFFHMRQKKRVLLADPVAERSLTEASTGADLLPSTICFLIAPTNHQGTTDSPSFRLERKKRAASFLRRIRRHICILVIIATALERAPLHDHHIASEWE